LGTTEKAVRLLARTQKDKSAGPLVIEGNNLCMKNVLIITIFLALI